MFVIVHNNRVVLGPMKWNRYRFENELLDEGVTYELPNKNDDFSPIIIDETTKILPVKTTQDPEYNRRTQRLDGPYWTFTDTEATSSYTTTSLPIEAIKNFMKEETANERWKKENGKVTVTINGAERQFSTDKQLRSTFHQYIDLGLEHVNWKFGRDDWGVITQQEIVTVFNAIMSYVKECYDWEYDKIAEIDAATTHDELSEIVIVEPTTNTDIPAELQELLASRQGV